MILSIGIIKCKPASKHKSDIKFKFGMKIVVEVVVEVVVVTSPLVHTLRRVCDQSQILRGSLFLAIFQALFIF